MTPGTHEPLPSANEPSGPSPPPSIRQTFLGLFILFQLIFLILSNLLGVIRWAPAELPEDQEVAKELKVIIDRAVPGLASKRGHVWEWTGEVENLLRRWSQLTGQDQNWSLFAPNPSEATGFPAVLLLWDEPTAEEPSLPGTTFKFDEKNGIHADVDLYNPAARAELLLSDNEPSDIHRYLRVGKCRLRKYEGQFYLDFRPNKEEAQTNLEWRISTRTRRLVTDYHDLVLTYLKWRLETWQRANPDQPKPKQVILVERFYRIRAPEESDNWAARDWDPAVLYVFGRWQPDRPPDEAGRKLEYFDYSTRQFRPPHTTE